MKKILVAFFALSFNWTFAQERQFTNDSDTAFWFGWRTELMTEIGLSTINQCTEKFEFRFSDGYKTIRLWGSEEQFQSEVIYYLREYQETEGGLAPEGRLFYSGQQLDERTTRSIKHLIMDFDILNLPTDSRIEGWDHGFDGITYFVETAWMDSVSFKTYWTPTAFPELKDARKIQYFVEQMNLIEEIKNGFEKFMSKQPFMSYYCGIGSAVIATKIE